MSGRKGETMEKDAIQALVDRLGIKMTAVFVPWSKSRNKGEKNKSLNWVVTICKGDHKVIETDYMAGIAHCPAYKNDKAYGLGMSILKDKAITFECEMGTRHRPLFSGGRDKPLQPDIIDVLYCLLSESDVLNYSNFEDWAGSVGFDTDSRQGEKIYKQCLETALSLRNGLGETVLEQLREAFQDY